jgi:hypothetical protein
VRSAEDCAGPKRPLARPYSPRQDRQTLHFRHEAVTHALHLLGYVGSKDNKEGQMFDELTSDLLDLTATVRGAGRELFASVIDCCSCCCSGCLYSC